MWTKPIEGPFYVDNAVDRFGRTFAFWAVWYRDSKDGELKQTGDEPFYTKFFAQREADRRNRIWHARKQSV